MSALSPIYAHFSETLTGLATIQPFRDEARFKQENGHRQEINQRANFCGKEILSNKRYYATQLITDREVFDRELPVIFIALLSGTQISNTLHRACVANLTHRQEHRSCRRIPTLVMCSDQNSLNLTGGKDN